MISEITLSSGDKFTMLLGYESVKTLAKGQQAGEDEMTLVENVALSAFNTWEKRNQLPQTSRDQMVEWFDDFGVFFQVKDAVEAFSVNFSQKVSELTTQKTGKKKV